MATLFERLDKGRPPPTEEAVKQHNKSKILLDWLMYHWAKPTIRAREIYTHGPSCIRDKKTTLSLARILVEQGRLIPNETHRHDMYAWKIVRENYSEDPLKIPARPKTQ
jgi:hypothetical protein